MQENKDNVTALLTESDDPKHILHRASIEHEFDKVIIIGTFSDGQGIVLSSESSNHEFALASMWLQKLVMEGVGFS